MLTTQNPLTIKSILVGVCLCLWLTTILSGCQFKPRSNQTNLDDDLSSADSLTPPIESDIGSKQTQSAELQLDNLLVTGDPNSGVTQEKTWQLVLSPQHITEGLSGVTVRLQLNSDQTLSFSPTPAFTIPQPLLDQGWISVINSITPLGNGSWHADLALINTQPTGLDIETPTTIAILNPPTNGIWSESTFSVTIDQPTTKAVTKSAQEVMLSFVNN